MEDMCLSTLAAADHFASQRKGDTFVCVNIEKVPAWCRSRLLPKLFRTQGPLLDVAIAASTNQVVTCM
jgi:hypothetical protein